MGNKEVQPPESPQHRSLSDFLMNIDDSTRDHQTEPKPASRLLEVGGGRTRKKERRKRHACDYPFGLAPEFDGFWFRGSKEGYLFKLFDGGEKGCIGFHKGIDWGCGIDA